MRRETRPLIGLKHIVCPAVLGGESEIGIQNPSRIVDKLELRVCRASSATHGSASDLGSTVHPASWTNTGDDVAHRVERLVRVTQIVSVGQRNRGGLNLRALGRPIRGLNVVRRGKSRRYGTGSIGSGAQALKKIVRGAVFLEDDHNV